MEKYLNQSIPGWDQEDDADINARFEFLLSSFPAAKTRHNSISYDEKMRFWKLHVMNASMLGLLSEEDSFVVKVSSIVTKFSRGTLFNGCIPQVMESLEKENRVINMKDWENKNRSNYDTILKTTIESLQSLKTKVILWVKWALFPFEFDHTTSNNVYKQNTKDDVYILSEYAKEISTKTIEEFIKRTYSERLLFLKDFIEACELNYRKRVNSEVRIFSKLDVLILITYIDDDQVTISQKQPLSQTNLSLLNEDTFSNVPIKITLRQLPYEERMLSNADSKLLEVKRKKQILNEQLDSLQKQILHLKMDAKRSIEQNNNSRAKMHLKQVKLLSSLSEKICVSISNFDTILTSVDSLETSSSIIEAYDCGAESFHGLREQLKVSIDSADDCIKKLNNITISKDGKVIIMPDVPPIQEEDIIDTRRDRLEALSS